jgi:hypothetical protein
MKKKGLFKLTEFWRSNVQIAQGTGSVVQATHWLHHLIVQTAMVGAPAGMRLYLKTGSRVGVGEVKVRLL